MCVLCSLGRGRAPMPSARAAPFPDALLALRPLHAAEALDGFWAARYYGSLANATAMLDEVSLGLVGEQGAQGSVYSCACPQGVWAG